MRSLPAVALAMLLASASLAFAQASFPAIVMPETQRPLVLKPDDIRPERLLPPPASPGSAPQTAELKTVEALQHEASAERRRQALWDDLHEDPSLFRPTFGPGFDLTAMPATNRLLEITRHDAAYAAGVSKVWFARRRPWTYDAKIVDCETGPGAHNPMRSYPSGHATLSYSLAVVLSDLRPDMAQPFLSRAADYAQSRLICGVHYPSDIAASEALAMVVADKILSDPQLASLRAASRSELAKAHLEPQAHPAFVGP